MQREKGVEENGERRKKRDDTKGIYFFQKLNSRKNRLLK
jgi:hypothetical protein